jgi:hypothetical protein
MKLTARQQSRQMLAQERAGCCAGFWFSWTGEMAATDRTVVVLMILMIVGLAVLYRYAPDREAPQWRWISLGSEYGQTSVMRQKSWTQGGGNGRPEGLTYIASRIRGEPARNNVVRLVDFVLVYLQADRLASGATTRRRIRGQTPADQCRRSYQRFGITFL